MTQKICSAYKHLILLALTCSVEALNKNIKSRPFMSFFIAKGIYLHVDEKRALADRKTAGDGHGKELRHFVCYLHFLYKIFSFKSPVV